MKDMDSIKTVKKEWMCKSETDDQILNGTEQNCDYFVDNLFEEAQKVGAICMPPSTVKNQVDVIIKLWKNGFTVNDGELRSYTGMANQQFLDSIKKGELPFELRKVSDKEEVDVKVEDKKDEVYLSSKKPVFHPFSGHGYRLGSATPRIISKVRDGHQGPANKRHMPLVPLNDLEPITNIQIWLADGERIIQKFNVSHRTAVFRDLPQIEKLLKYYTVRFCRKDMLPVLLCKAISSDHGFNAIQAAVYVFVAGQKKTSALEDNSCKPFFFIVVVVLLRVLRTGGIFILALGYGNLRISHVRDFITKYQGSEGSVPFTLTTSLPFRELRDETLTLEEAKLQNAVVVQRLQKTTEPFRLLVIKAPDNDYKTAATPNGQLKSEQKSLLKVQDQISF